MHVLTPRYFRPSITPLAVDLLQRDMHIAKQCGGLGRFS
jgi:hypothetical protein